MRSTYVFNEICPDILMNSDYEYIAQVCLNSKHSLNIYYNKNTPFVMYIYNLLDNICFTQRTTFTIQQSINDIFNTNVIGETWQPICVKIHQDPPHIYDHPNPTEILHTTWLHFAQSDSFVQIVFTCYVEEVLYQEIKRSMKRNMRRNTYESMCDTDDDNSWLDKIPLANTE